jgi:hypothetical protein
MIDLHDRHCLNHAEREAVARCPECKQFYCRECIAEHEDRVICASCLRKLRKARDDKKYSFARLTRAAAFCLSFGTTWVVFYWVGKILLSIPVAFHDGTVWQTGFWNE